MNERIKELITQAGGHWNHGDFNMPSSVEFQKQDIEKFAELIVRECIEICEEQRATYTKLCKDSMNFIDKNLYAEGEITAHRIRLSIQKHFGVEE